MTGLTFPFEDDYLATADSLAQRAMNDPRECFNADDEDAHLNNSEDWRLHLEMMGVQFA